MRITENLEDGFVLRLARNIPRSNTPGVGLHCYYYAKLSKRRSIIITKSSNSDAIIPRRDTKIFAVKYTDKSAKKKILNYKDYLLIAPTKLYGELRMLAATINQVKKERAHPSIVHIHSVNYLLTGLIIKLIYNSRVCLNCGGTEVLRAPKIPFYRHFFRYLDAVFYVSKSMEPDLFNLVDRDKCVYTSNGLDHSIFNKKIEIEKKDQIVAVGNLRWAKNYTLLIKAFASVHEQYPSWRLRIFGDGPDRGMLESLIYTLGLDDKVYLEGTVSQIKIRDELNVSKIYAIASIQEGLPKALIEAMACGLPVISTDAGECREILEPEIRTIKVNDEQSYANELSKLMGDNQYRDQVAEYCIAKSARFSWDSVTKIIEATYDKLIMAEEK